MNNRPNQRQNNPLSSLLQNILGGGGGQNQQGPPPGAPFPHGGGPPPGPPPKFSPKQSPASMQATANAGTYAVDPGAIRPCVGKYVYIWLRGGYSFWAWLTFVGRRSVAGYRWTGHRWVYFGIDRRQIVSFVCY
ncbi:transporter [Pseudalkalibacillus sp. Hm43]|uniref:transporter n=1 Tax=Pseudalkalibacillus sp. Hm43 TaxID=3450742 RepID=UPI003F43A701